MGTFFNVFRWSVFMMIFVCMALAIVNGILGKYVWMVIQIGCVILNTANFTWLTLMK